MANLKSRTIYLSAAAFNELVEAVQALDEAAWAKGETHGHLIATDDGGAVDIDEHGPLVILRRKPGGPAFEL